MKSVHTWRYVLRCFSVGRWSQGRTTSASLLTALQLDTTTTAAAACHRWHWWRFQLGRTTLVLIRVAVIGGCILQWWLLRDFNAEWCAVLHCLKCQLLTPYRTLADVCIFQLASSSFTMPFHSQLPRCWILITVCEWILDIGTGTVHCRMFRYLPGFSLSTLIKNISVDTQ